MIREHLGENALAAEKDFRWRGCDVTRLEGFSDAVFAYAVTLLVVSLEVPKAYHELMQATRGFAALGVCFAVLTQVWFGHYRFFRRYGLPKFLFFAMVNGGVTVDLHQAHTLLLIYRTGLAAMSMVFALLYLHAWKDRELLGLNEIERLRTRHTLADNPGEGVCGTDVGGPGRQLAGATGGLIRLFLLFDWRVLHGGGIHFRPARAAVETDLARRTGGRGNRGMKKAAKAKDRSLAPFPNAADAFETRAEPEAKCNAMGPAGI